MKETTVFVGQKGVLVFAKSKDSSHDDWLVLISNVTEKSDGLYVKGYIFYNLTTHVWYFDRRGESWGYTTHFEFYEPTREQKQKISNELARRGFKYVPVLNKLVKYGSYNFTI